MQTRRVSSDQIWIEMPLAPRTLRLVWRAMAQCGLKNGKINSFQDVHFGPLYNWQNHMVEGRTPQGLFADNVKVQATLCQHEGGTLVEFAAANVKGDFDFGGSSRFKRRLVPRIEEFLKNALVDWDEEPQLTPVAPLASATDFGLASARDDASFEVILSLKSTKLSAKDWAQIGRSMVLFAAGSWVAGRFHLWAPLFLFMAGLELWNWRRRGQKFNWSSFALFAGLGAHFLWRLLTRGF